MLISKALNSSARADDIQSWIQSRELISRSKGVYNGRQQCSVADQGIKLPLPLALSHCIVRVRDCPNLITTCYQMVQTSSPTTSPLLSTVPTSKVVRGTCSPVYFIQAGSRADSHTLRRPRRSSPQRLRVHAAWPLELRKHDIMTRSRLQESNRVARGSWEPPFTQLLVSHSVRLQASADTALPQST